MADDAAAVATAEEATEKEASLGGKEKTSPLYRIREKEVEISGRILEVRDQAERIVADARRAATDTVNDAREAADRRADERIAEVLGQAESEAESARAEIAARVKELESRLESRKDAAVELVLRIVTDA